MPNSVRRKNFGKVAAFLKLAAEAMAQDDQWFFHTVIEETG